ncbi:hypothetical protein EBT25_18160, partial [bacterium]|nr:hypothetical protein [bacterium]
MSLWLLLGLYLAVIIFLMYFVATYEPFESDSNSQATCMKCMVYFQDVLGLSNSKDILSYVKGRGAFIQTFMDQYVQFSMEGMDKCTKSGKEITTSDIISCFTTVLNEMLTKCQEKNTYADCVVSKTLGERILKEATICGKDTCSLDEFRQKFVATVEQMKQEFYECQMAFQKADDPCVKMYASLIDLKQGSSIAQDKQMPEAITRAEVEEKLGDLAAFAMTMS